jgi:drug/metabolite transporter (DMT)-like permease
VTSTALALVLLAAVIHAIWNAAAKRARHHFSFLWLAFVVSCALLLLCFPLWLAPFPAAALPYLIASCVIHAAYIWLLGRAYELGDFSRVYPLARGLGVALVPLLAWLCYGERVDLLGAGIALVTCGIAWVGLAGQKRLMLPGAGQGGRWALLTGLAIAAFQVVDRGAVMYADPKLYIALMMFGTLICTAPLAFHHRRELAEEVRTSWRGLLFFGPGSLLGYGIVLTAFTMAKTGYVVAARESSVLFSVLIGAMLFHEGNLQGRLSGAALIVLGVLLVAFAK